MDSRKPKGQDHSTEEAILRIGQLQAKAVELKTGLTGAMQHLATLKQKDICLEERISSYQKDMDGEIVDIRSCLSTFKEDLSTTLSQIDDISRRQRDMWKCLELLQVQAAGRVLTSQARKGTKEDSSEDGRKHFSSQNSFSIVQHYFTSLSDRLAQLSSVSTQIASVSENEVDCTGEVLWTSPVWTEHWKNAEEKSFYSRKKQTAAMELLKSERVYVSYLSLLLKANVAFNRNEAIHIKDMTPFPSCLRFLIQEHLKLLHTLQERLLKCQWKGIMGDVFLRLASKENRFLDHYVTYLKELPRCLSVIAMHSSSFTTTADLIKVDVSEGQPSLYTLLLQPVQRIPGYLQLLQNLLKQTDAEHPDHCLLLISIKQFEVFVCKFGSLLQRSEELLLQGRMDVKREETNLSMRSKEKQVDQTQLRCLEDWEVETPRYGLQTPCFMLSKETNMPRERSPQDTQEPLRGPSPLLSFKFAASGSTTEKTVDEFLLTGDDAGQESLCDEEDFAHGFLNSDGCSTSSSDSSSDITFLYWHGDRTPQPHGRGQSQLLSLACTSLEQRCPLQVVQRKSRSLNGLQLDSSATDTGGYRGQSHHGPVHARLDRQYSAGTPGCKVQTASSLQKLGAESVTEKVEIWREQNNLVSFSSTYSCQAQALHTSSSVNAQDQDDPSWADKPKWRKTEGSKVPVSFSLRSQKQEQKGGFRSSFKKLFKKKSSGEKIKAKEELESALTPPELS